MATKMFPIHPGTRREFPELPDGIPWVVMVPHEQQARKNHSQSLERLAERGGLSAKEMMAVIWDVDYDQLPMTETKAVEELKRFLTCEMLLR